jgi:hypothetical protein
VGRGKGGGGSHVLFHTTSEMITRIMKYDYTDYERGLHRLKKDYMDGKLDGRRTID